MILGIGTDIIEIARVAKAIEKKEFVEKVFTATEIAYCQSKKNAESFAGCYAAKEALFKAIGTGWREGMSILDINISHDQIGKPIIEVSGKTAEKINAIGGGNIHLTISHNKESAIAFVIIEQKSN